MKIADENNDHRAGRPADHLEALKKRLKKAKGGYRHTKYEIIAETMRSVIRMRSDAKELLEFVERNNLRSKTTPDKSWIASAAFSFVNHSEKQGWKDARVAEFLVDVKKVPIGKLAKEILRLGGIAKIIERAAKEDPRRPDRRGKDGFNGAAEARDAPIFEKCDDFAGAMETKIAVRISPELVSKIKAINPERRVKLICLRQGKTAVRILKVTAIKPRIDPASDDNDEAWT
jgi:hypothetical protein